MLEQPKMLNMRDSFKRCAVLKLVLHLSKNGSTRGKFERWEQKGVLGPDRDLYLKDKSSQHRDTGKMLRNAFCLWFVITWQRVPGHLHMAGWHNGKLVVIEEVPSNLQTRPVCCLA